jgi:hypothetical protein
MRALAGELLLAAWEEGAPEHELRRPLILLRAALPDAEGERLGALPIAERNLLLLRLHELSFGPALSVFGVCPACAARLEFAVPVAEMVTRLEDPAAVSPVWWSEEGRRYRLRPVTTDDLLGTLDAADLSAAQELLLARCLEMSPAAGPGGAATRRPEPAEGSGGALRRFEQLHKATELSCTIECPGCSGTESLDFDIARFLWAEVRNAARRLLGEIHELASAYGWSEQDIARMSAGRREAYLELLSA